VAAVEAEIATQIWYGGCNDGLWWRNGCNGGYSGGGNGRLMVVPWWLRWLDVVEGEEMVCDRKWDCLRCNGLRRSRIPNDLLFSFYNRYTAKCNLIFFNYFFIRLSATVTISDGSGI